MVKEEMYEDFTKYAKEQFDVKVNVVKSDNPDTFEKIFGQIFREDDWSSRKVRSKG